MEWVTLDMLRIWTPFIVLLMPITTLSSLVTNVDYYTKFASYKYAKKNTLEVTHEGTNQVKEPKLIYWYRSIIC